MSSMSRGGIFTVLLLGLAAPASTQVPYAVPVATAYDVSASIGDWRRLRQSDRYSFADYARFLIANPGWPGESTLRLWAEKAMRPGENPATVLTFFAAKKPTTGSGYARYSDALAATGQMAGAIVAAKSAWVEPELSVADETNLTARYWSYFTAADHDSRVDLLLFAKKPLDAQRILAATSPARRAAFAARIAMQTRSPAAESLYQAVIGTVTSDAGLMMDRARYLRDSGYESAARSLAARPHNFVYRPADVERFYDMLLVLAGGALSDGQYTTAYNIARQVDDALPAGVEVSTRPYGVRDNYTSLAWLAGTTALDRLNHPVDAIAMFDRYSRAGKSLQVLTKGVYWAGRASLSAGRATEASAYFQRASAYPELFYGQLALERLGRSVPPPAATPTILPTPAQRTAFQSRRLVQAMRSMVSYGRADEQMLFVRGVAESLDNDSDRALAVELGQQIRRQDLQVWVARAARNSGSAFYVRQAFPTLSASVSPDLWSLAHGITRQESSFDPWAISHAGARGMMQLMPGTAREQAGKLGMAYDGSRLTEANYNVMLGSAYFRRLLNTWDGNVPLAVASYNAGTGNVRKWISTYGDPRSTDVLRWIESIPFVETRGYVQRVIENSVVYDSLRPAPQQQSAMHVSRYLGKSRPG